MRGRPVVSSVRMKDASRDAADRLARQGLSLPERPEGDGIPDLPSELHALSDEALMKLWTALSGWSEYLTTQMAAAQVDERFAEKAVEKAQAKAMLDGWTGKATERVAIAKAKFLDSDESAALIEEHDALYAYRKLVETLSVNTEKKIALVSRELTRRTSENTRKGWGRP